MRLHKVCYPREFHLENQQITLSPVDYPVFMAVSLCVHAGTWVFSGGPGPTGGL